jgi:predicted DNA binding CopG/RHH family protein
MSTKTKTEQKAGAIEIPNFASSGHESDWWAGKEGRDHLHEQIRQAEKNQTLRRGTPPQALKALAAAGRTVSINIRIPAADLQKAHQLAAEKGIGYQTLIKMLLHEAVGQEKTPRPARPASR